MPAEWFSRPASKSLCLSCSCILWSLATVYISVLWRTELRFPRQFRFSKKALLPDVDLARGIGVLSLPTPTPHSRSRTPPQLFHAPWSVGCRLHCLHVLREKLHQGWSGVKGLARHDVTWKRRQQKQKEVAPAGVNPMSTCFSSFIPKAPACLLLFLLFIMASVSLLLCPLQKLLKLLPCPLSLK